MWQKSSIEISQFANIVLQTARGATAAGKEDNKLEACTSKYHERTPRTHYPCDAWLLWYEIYYSLVPLIVPVMLLYLVTSPRTTWDLRFGWIPESEEVLTRNALCLIYKKHDPPLQEWLVPTPGLFGAEKQARYSLCKERCMVSGLRSWRNLQASPVYKYEGYWNTVMSETIVLCFSLWLVPCCYIPATLWVKITRRLRQTAVQEQSVGEKDVVTEDGTFFTKFLYMRKTRSLAVNHIQSYKGSLRYWAKSSNCAAERFTRGTQWGNTLLRLHCLGHCCQQWAFMCCLMQAILTTWKLSGIGWSTLLIL